MDKLKSDGIAEIHKSDGIAEIHMLRCLLSYHERVTLPKPEEISGLDKCYMESLKDAIRCMKIVYGITDAEL